MVQANLDPTAWIVDTNTAFSNIDSAFDSFLDSEAILFSDGLFVASSPLLITSGHNKTVVGQGQGRTSLRASATVLGVSSASQDFSLRNLLIENTGGGTVVDCVAGSGFCAEDVVFRGVLNIEGYDDTIIKNCYIDGKILINSEASVTEVIIKDCIVNGLIEIAPNYIISPASIHVIIDNVLVIGSATNGIYIDDTSDFIANVLIKNCTVKGCGTSGIFVNGGRKVHIIDNIVTANDIGIRFATQPTEGYYVANNKVFENISYEAKTSSALDLEHNWWGTNAPTTSLFDGAVDFTPYMLLPSDMAIISQTMSEHTTIISSLNTIEAYTDNPESMLNTNEALIQSKFTTNEASISQHNTYVYDTIANVAGITKTRITQATYDSDVPPAQLGLCLTGGSGVENVLTYATDSSGYLLRHTYSNTSGAYELFISPNIGAISVHYTKVGFTKPSKYLTV